VRFRLARWGNLVAVLGIFGCRPDPQRDTIPSAAREVAGLRIEGLGRVGAISAVSPSSDSLCMAFASWGESGDQGKTWLLFGNVATGRWTRATALDSTHAEACRLIRSPLGTLFAALYPSMRLFQIDPDGSASPRGDFLIPISQVLRAADLQFTSEDTLWALYRLSAVLDGATEREYLFLANWSPERVLRDTVRVAVYDKTSGLAAGVALHLGPEGNLLLCPRAAPAEPRIAGDPLQRPDSTLLCAYTSPDRRHWTARDLPPPAGGSITSFGSDANPGENVILFENTLSSILTARSVGSDARPFEPAVVGTGFMFTVPDGFGMSLASAATGRGTMEIAWLAGIQAVSARGLPMDMAQIVVRHATIDGAASQSPHRGSRISQLRVDRSESATALAQAARKRGGILVIGTLNDDVPEYYLGQIRVFLLPDEERATRQ
jgi:hypothetical protein